MDLNILFLLSEIVKNPFPGLTDNLIKSIAFYAALLIIAVGIILLFLSKYSNSSIARIIKESTSIKIIISVISGLIAWFLPWKPLKILFFSVAIVALFSIFLLKRKISHSKAILLGVLALFAVAAIVSVPVFNYCTHYNVTPEISFKFPSDLSDSKNKVLPDSEMSLEGVNHITIDVNSNIELELTNDGDTLHYPSELTVKGANGTLTISGPYSKNDTYLIKMGTATLRSVNIDCQGIKIHGNGSFRDLSLDCTGVLINSQISSENDIRIDCTGIDISGTLEGKMLKIDGLGTNIVGELNFSKILLNSTGVNLSITSTFDRFEIDSTGLNGIIEVSNPRDQNAELHIDAAGGNLTVDSKNDAPVEIESTSLVKIIRN